MGLYHMTDYHLMLERGNCLGPRIWGPDSLKFRRRSEVSRPRNFTFTEIRKSSCTSSVDRVQQRRQPEEKPK
jgi:hypothetical protein